MGLTVAWAASKDQTDGLGIKFRLRKVTFDSSYPTGGEVIAASDFGLTRIHSLITCGPAVKSDGTDCVPVAWDPVNGKLLAYFQKDPAAAGGANIALPEVGNTISLASYSVHVVAIGS